VCHEGLLYKIKAIFSDSIYKILQSYLQIRYFLIQYRKAYTSLHPVSSGVPKGSVIGPLLYLLYTTDLPAVADTETTTYADDTAVLTTHADPAIATHRLQTALHEIQQWFKKWRRKVNERKSTHVTFTSKRSVCPSVQLNNKHLAQPDDIKWVYICIAN